MEYWKESSEDPLLHRRGSAQIKTRGQTSFQKPPILRTKTQTRRQNNLEKKKKKQQETDWLTDTTEMGMAWRPQERYLLKNSGSEDLMQPWELYCCSFQKGYDERRQYLTDTAQEFHTPLDFPGDAVDKNPPANAGHTSSIPGLGRFHMPWSN